MWRAQYDRKPLNHALFNTSSLIHEEDPFNGVKYPPTQDRWISWMHLIRGDLQSHKGCSTSIESKYVGCLTDLLCILESPP